MSSSDRDLTGGVVELLRSPKIGQAVDDVLICPNNRQTTLATVKCGGEGNEENKGRDIPYDDNIKIHYVKVPPHDKLNLRSFRSFSSTLLISVHNLSISTVVVVSQCKKERILAGKRMYQSIATSASVLKGRQTDGQSPVE